MNNFKSKILIFAIIFVPITISLGLWQIERANEKKVIISNYDKLLVSTPITLQKEQPLENWQPIETVGAYQDLVIYEDNAINSGKAGFKVYHLFQNGDGTFIFVHRGFIERNLIKNNLPVFGICLGHQLLALTLGAKTAKMKLGHRGANHPVKNLVEDKVEITSQNHGFEVIKRDLPKKIKITHQSLFDNSIEGIQLKNKPVFSVQYHPESNPGPQDSVYLFKQFITSMKKNVKKKRY